MTRKNKKHPEIVGKKEPVMDFFTDVNRALSRYLMRNDPTFARASELAKARNAQRKLREVAQ
jgi:hypothetical protein